MAIGRLHLTSWEVLNSRFYSLVVVLRERVDSFLVLKQVDELMLSRLRRALKITQKSRLR